MTGDFTVTEVIKYAASLGALAAVDEINGENIEASFNDYLGNWPGELVQTQMPQYMYQIAVQAYMLAYVREI